MAEFFAMGGYAFHVWTCWGASAVLLGGLAIARHRRLRRMAELAGKLDGQGSTGNSVP